MTPDYRYRLELLRKRMAQTNTDLVAVGPSSHMAWLAGLNPHGDERPVMLLVSADYAGLLIPALNADSQRARTDLPFHCWRDETGPDQALSDLLSRCGAESSELKLALDETMRADFALLLIDALPGARRCFLGETVGVLRAVKDASEYEALRASAHINDAAIAAGFAGLRTGISEAEVAEIIKATQRKAGAETAFVSVCFGTNSAFPHHHTGATKLAPGMAVLIDAGARFMGYPSDMTRIGYHGTPEPEFFAVSAVLEKAVQAALAAARPGVPAADVDKAARTVIASAGYGDAFSHRTGHGVGLDLHEEPYISAASNWTLSEGNVFSIEPGIYLPDRFGQRLEEVVILRADGPEILSRMPRDPIFPGSFPDPMSAPEKKRPGPDLVSL